MMVSNTPIRSSSLRKYVLDINVNRLKNRSRRKKKRLSAEQIAKKLIEENGDELKKLFIRL